MTVTTSYNVNTLKGPTPVPDMGTEVLANVVGLQNGGYAIAYFTGSVGYEPMIAFHDAALNPSPSVSPSTGVVSFLPVGAPALARLANGNVLVVWDDNDAAGLTGRLYSPAGASIGDAFHLVGGLPQEGEDVQVAAGADGGFALSYTMSGNVFFARFDGAGTLLAGSQVNTVATTGTQNDAAITVLADGGFVVTYTDTNPSDQQLRAAVYNANGSLRKADFLLDMFGDNTQSNVVGLPNGNWAVVYTDTGWGNEGGTTGITMQIYDASGADVTPGAFFHVNAPSFEEDVSPDAAVLSNGFIAVTWNKGFGIEESLFGRIFDQNGNAINNIVDSEFGQFEIDRFGVRNPTIAALNNGAFATAWDFVGHGTSNVSELVRISNGDDADDVIVSDNLRDVINGSGGDDTVVFSQTLDKYALTDFGNVIAVSGADGTDTLTSVEHLQFADGTIHVNDGNVLFDTVYYMSHNPDVFAAGVDALWHFNTFGWHEGRDPNAWFDTSGYLAVNKDVAANGGNPLDHYHNNGWHEGRDPSANFDTTLYLINNPDVAAAGIDPLAHFLANGLSEGRSAYAAVGPVSNGFDTQYYLFHNPDVAAAGVDPLIHYNVFGWQEGRDPNAWFDSSGYLSHYGDVAAAGINPFDHYMSVGWKEGRDASTAFDTTGYLAAYPDVAAAGVNPLDHFLQFGIYEGRQAVNDGMWG